MPIDVPVLGEGSGKAQSFPMLLSQQAKLWEGNAIACCLGCSVL